MCKICGLCIKENQDKDTISDLSFHIGLHGKIVSTTDQVLGWYRVIEEDR